MVGPSPPSPRPRSSWTNTLTTFLKSHYKVGYEEEGELGLALFVPEVLDINVLSCGVGLIKNL